MSIKHHFQSKYTIKRALCTQGMVRWLHHIRSDLKGIPCRSITDMGIAANWGNMRLSGLPDHSLTLQL
jgi:hypothetical protein